MKRLVFTVGMFSILPMMATSASAQTSDFRGLRVEGQVGDNRFHSQGTHDDHFSYGIAGGFDGLIADKIVIGPGFSYWRGRGENITPGVTGGTIAHKGFEELGAGVRAGYLVMPKLLVYGLGGYVNSEQRKAFSGVGAIGAGGFYDHVHTDGYQLGAGAEYSLTQRFYVSAGYRYANYQDHTSQERAFVGAGVRF